MYKSEQYSKKQKKENKNQLKVRTVLYFGFDIYVKKKKILNKLYTSSADSE